MSDTPPVNETVAECVCEGLTAIHKPHIDQLKAILEAAQLMSGALEGSVQACNAESEEQKILLQKCSETLTKLPAYTKKLQRICSTCNAVNSRVTKMVKETQQAAEKARLGK